MVFVLLHSSGVSISDPSVVPVFPLVGSMENIERSDWDIDRGCNKSLADCSSVILSAYEYIKRVIVQESSGPFMES